MPFLGSTPTSASGVTIADGSISAVDLSPNLDLTTKTVSLPEGSTTLGGATIPKLDLTVSPEVLEIQANVTDSGQDATWLWTWTTSSLPYSRVVITNLSQTSVPLYKQGTYVINNYAGVETHSGMSQTHSLYLKWIEGAGTDNNVDWVTTITTTDSHPSINDGNSTGVQRLSFQVPSTIILPTLTAPNISYTVSNNGNGAYTFSGNAHGDNPDIGPFYRGGTYTFNVSASGHPLYLTTDNGTGFVAGSYVGEYTDGVTGSRTDSGTLTITVPNDAPDTLYYQCGNHSVMRGTIRVKDLAVETNADGNYILYLQHTQDSHATPVEIRPIPSMVDQMCLVYDATNSKFVPQDMATYLERTPNFKRKIQDVAGTATLVAADGSAAVSSIKVYAYDSYLPVLNNNEGDMAFISDNRKLKIWTGTNWEEAAGSLEAVETSTVSPSSYNGESGTTFTVTGTGFGTGTNAFFITSNNRRYASSTVTINSSTELELVTPQDFSVADGPLSLQIVGPNGIASVLTDVISTGGVPTWTTASGSFGTFLEGSSINQTVEAVDPDAGSTITYSVASGALPSGVTINASTGVISGSLPAITNTTTYNFTIRATDNAGNTADQSFSLSSTASSVSWTTTSGSLGSIYQGRTETKTVAATTTGTGLTYSHVGGTLPTGYSVNSSTGAISGNASGLGDYTTTTRSFTIRAQNAQGKYEDRAFSIVQASRYVGYSCYTTGEGGVIAPTAPSGYVWNRKDFSAYGQPNGSCPNFTYGGCNSSAAQNWAPALPSTTFSFAAQNGVWGDPCGGTTKRGYVRMTYGGY